MTEKRALYDVPDKPQINPAALLRAEELEYENPTFEDVRALKALSGETGGQLAARVKVDPRTVRKWVAPPESGNHYPIPYSAWRLLLVELGMVDGRHE